MKLKTFDRSLAGIRLSDNPGISINQKNGLFRFNNCIIDLLNLEINDKVKLYQDEENPEDWYIKKVDKTDDLGLVIRRGSSTVKTFIVCSMVAARTLFKSIGFTGNAISC